VLETASQIRRACQIPLVLYIYYNLVHRHGLERFIEEASAAGIDGLLVLDLPPEEGGDYTRMMEKAGLCPILLVAPTTPDERIASIVKQGRGFVYYVSREGVTGMQSQIAANLEEMTARIRRHTELPIAVGFGISDPNQARRVANHAEAVVVGSAVVARIGEQGHSPEMVKSVAGFVGELARAIKTSDPG
jgi:tryptophan synthase alpha chain